MSNSAAPTAQAVLLQQSSNPVGACEANYAPYFNGFLIILGWIAVHYLTAVREKQKDIRELKQKIKDTVVALEKRGILFHKASAFDINESQSLITELGRLGRSIIAQPIARLDIDVRMIVAFKKSITLRNFEPSTFQQQPASSFLVCDISRTADELIDALDSAVAERYMGGWWQTFRL